MRVLGVFGSGVRDGPGAGGGGTSLGCGLRGGETVAEWPTAGGVVSPSGGHLEGLGDTSLGGVGNEGVLIAPW